MRTNIEVLLLWGEKGSGEMNEIEKAIKTLQGESGCVELDLSNGNAGEKAQDFADACHVAVEALREKQEREDPKPLTLEELMEMTREPVYDADDENWYVIDYVDIVDELSTLIVMTDSTEFDSENGLPKFYRTKLEEAGK